MANNISHGSEWRIWDLHVHSPATYGGEYSEFIQNASQSVAAVIGINDYCTIKGYQDIVRLGGVPGKVIFPVVELRMNNLLHTRHNQNGIKINFHIIFNNTSDIENKISTWLQSLKCKDERGNDAQLGSITDISKVSFDFDETIKSLKQYNLYGEHALVWLPYDEYGGIDEINPISDGFFKLSLINSTHIMGSSTKNQIDFFKWDDEKFSLEQYKSWFDQPKPCIKGSDAHKINYPFGQLMNQHSQPTDKYCWINADTTFNGLRQIIVEPDRVFIGDEPDLIKRVRNNKTKFIQSLSIAKVDGVVMDDIWFENFDLNFNSGLVAIIGNKGGGKSAITDIVGLCGNTYQDPSNFSFLTNQKFRKPKPFNLSDKFQATLKWHDGTFVTKQLNENPDKNLTERVKYIPQNFLERLCANVESDDFEREIKQIIFSHTPSDKRLGKTTLDDLILYKSSLVQEEINQTQSEVAKSNAVIINLELQETEDYKKSIEDKLKTKQEELDAHLFTKPNPPAAAENVSVDTTQMQELEALRGQIQQLENEINTLQNDKTTLSLLQEELKRAVQYYTGIDEQLKKIVDPDNEYVKLLVRRNIEPSAVFSYTVDTSNITSDLNQVNELIAEIETQLSETSDQSKPAQLKALNEKLKNKQEELDKPAKDHQKYLDDVKAWNIRQAQITGDTNTENSFKFFEQKLEYLKTNLASDLTTQYDQRAKLIEQLYLKKISLIDIRKELFQPVTQFIADFKELKKRYDVKIDVALELRSFPENFFQYINQQRKGSFSGKEEGYKKLNEVLEKSNFDSAASFKEFADAIVDLLKFDKRPSTPERIDINSQLRNGTNLLDVYNYIFNFNYLQPVYNLKLGTKTLQELSPGERGALLLIFYLILDKDDIPLIIDQPEENLDNESVYHILVHFIKKVKENRQIIIVTHNPNLAIVCDADQIVHMHIDKEHKNAVEFYSGAIEDEITNKKVIDILEGTLPAFNNRDLKYIR